MRDLKETHPILAQLGYHEMIGCFDSETDLDRLGRVMRQDRQRYSVITENGIVRAALTTGQRFDPRDKTAFPVVGDWVTLGSLEANNATTPITGRIPRRSKLSRRASGDNYLEQILVSNLDLIFVVSGLDQNFNLNRIQRFLTMAWSCGLPAILLLSKADIAEDADAKIKALEPILHGTKVYTDASSLYLTTTQKIPINVASKNYKSYSNPPESPNLFTGDQIIVAVTDENPLLLVRTNGERIKITGKNFGKPYAIFGNIPV